MNVIDTLIVKLGLDTADFKRGTEEASKAQSKFVDQSRQQGEELDDVNKKHAEAQESRAKDLEARSKAIAQSYAKIRNQALSMLAVFTAGKGLSSFTKDAAQQALTLENLAENLGIGEEKLLGYAQAAKNAGSSIQGVYALLTKASNDAALRRRGEVTEEIRVAYRYGDNIKDDDFKDAESWLMKQSDILNSIRQQQGEQEALVIAERMGIARTEFNLLKMGSGPLREQIEAGKQVRGLTKEQIEDLAELSKQLNDTSAAFETTGERILSGIAPYLKNVLSEVRGFLEWMSTSDFQNFVGEKTAQVLAFFGDDDAKHALEVNQKDDSEYQARQDDRDKEKHRKRREDYDKDESAVKFFESKGWTREQANGIVANLKAESELNHKAVGDGGKAYGVAQWHPDRQDIFKDAFGYDMRRAGQFGQYEFVDYELKHNEKAAGDRLKKAKTSAEATEIFQIYFERPDPKNRARDTEKRQTIAAKLDRTEPASAPAQVAQPVPAPAQTSSTTPLQTQADDKQDATLKGAWQTIAAKLDRTEPAPAQVAQPVPAQINTKAPAPTPQPAPLQVKVQAPPAAPTPQPAPSPAPAPAPAPTKAPAPAKQSTELQSTLRDILPLLVGRPDRYARLASPARQAMEAKYSTVNTTNDNRRVQNIQNDTKVGPITVNMQGGDPRKIAKAIPDEIEKKILVLNGSSGMR